MRIDHTVCKSKSTVDAKCQTIRAKWTESERMLRELRATLAQTRLAVSILFRDMQSGSPT